MMSFKCWLAAAAAVAAVKEIKQEQQQQTTRSTVDLTGGRANGEREEERECTALSGNRAREKGFYTKRRDESSAGKKKTLMDDGRPSWRPEKLLSVCVCVSVWSTCKSKC